MPTGLGYTTFYPHAIYPGLEFDKFFDRPKSQHEVIASGVDFDTFTTVEQIKKIIDTHHRQCARIANQFREFKSLQKKVAEIEKFLQNHLPYREDGNHEGNGRKSGDEELHTPNFLWFYRSDEKQSCDCDDYCIFAGCILKCLGINFIIRKVDLHGSGFHHIYVVVPKDQKKRSLSTNQAEYFAIDPVIKGINNEIQPIIEKYDTPMSRLTVLSGVRQLKHAQRTGSVHADFVSSGQLGFIDSISANGGTAASGSGSPTSAELQQATQSVADTNGIVQKFQNLFRGGSGPDFYRWFEPIAEQNVKDVSASMISVYRKGGIQRLTELINGAQWQTVKRNYIRQVQTTAANKHRSWSSKAGEIASFFTNVYDDLYNNIVQSAQSNPIPRNMPSRIPTVISENRPSNFVELGPTTTSSPSSDFQPFGYGPTSDFSQEPTSFDRGGANDSGPSNATKISLGLAGVAIAGTGVVLVARQYIKARRKKRAAAGKTLNGTKEPALEITL